MQLLSKDCCKVNRFYIKPQQRDCGLDNPRVVKLIDSTSNHNTDEGGEDTIVVVKLIDSTSNHNLGFKCSR